MRMMALSQSLFLIKPMLDAETTGGGYPGWVGNIEGDLRTNNSAYTEGAPLRFITTFET